MPDLEGELRLSLRCKKSASASVHVGLIAWGVWVCRKVHAVSRLTHAVTNQFCSLESAQVPLAASIAARGVQLCIRHYRCKQGCSAHRPMHDAANQVKSQSRKSNTFLLPSRAFSLLMIRYLTECVFHGGVTLNSLVSEFGSSSVSRSGHVHVHGAMGPPEHQRAKTK